MRARALTLMSVVAPFIPAASTNYSHHPMPASHVRLVVVHETEGSYDATVSWFRNPRARAAAHYVVGRDGRITHMVSNARPAWHAGNSYVNAHSIGVEHEGYAGIDGTVTDTEYRASAELVASLLRKYHLPIDRGHVIGHSEVPDPYHRGAFGGYSHHTDPGAFWDWPRYMAYVRAYRGGHAPPPRPLDVTIAGLTLGQTVSGLVPLTAAATAGARVEFEVDGVVRASIDAAPSTWGWDTALEDNGRHVLTVRAVDAAGRTAIASVVVKSQTPPAPPPTVTLPDPLPPLTGLVPLTPLLGGGPVAKVELWIDGAVVQTVEAAPWTLTWDVSAMTPGQHTLAIRVVGPRGRAAAAVTVVTIP